MLTWVFGFLCFARLYFMVLLTVYILEASKNKFP